MSLRVCAGWSEPLLVAHTILLEISCHGLYVISNKMCCADPFIVIVTRYNLIGYIKCTSPFRRFVDMSINLSFSQVAS